jgi:hypothetical protein
MDLFSLLTTVFSEPETMPVPVPIPIDSDSSSDTPAGDNGGGCIVA